MTSRRSALIAAATVLALSAVAACNDGDAQSAPTAAGAPATPSGTTSSAPTGTASSAATADTPTVAPTPAATAMPSPAGAPVDAASPFASTTDNSVVAGYPQITVPAGYTDQGLPLGVSFLGTRFSDARLLGYAYAFEQATHARHAPNYLPTLP
ncbi:amidase family protein [Streptomyces sp. BE20]|uniref:amidase family protein n=1 Tax=Streptomyces sp. BE20 TaxID=3002525 RepID=UPI002E76AA46|nr:amidase family protein [Streptomyces sp. BE20]MEE1824288.1 amidase family protein [Streptomyces sp. BE20]